MAYQTHPYQWPTIGKEISHIANATLDEVKEFFYRFYAPNNAILAVTGHISLEETIQLARKMVWPYSGADGSETKSAQGSSANCNP